MGRCKKNRCCRYIEGKRIFKPLSVPLKEIEIYEIKADEFEALRLCDMENKSQIEAGEIMQISRGTIQRLLIHGRSTLIRALLNNGAIQINSEDQINNEEKKDENMYPNDGQSKSIK
ncbi:MAG: DUF134 domain-containing protein [Acidobacteria bacterium]|jgi:predicted DNA-binding protein (UPF0251 family)|nr:DUF134 domain-containing protein [Acidobacteriota bacterium]